MTAPFSLSQINSSSEIVRASVEVFVRDDILRDKRDCQRAGRCRSDSYRTHEHTKPLAALRAGGGWPRLGASENPSRQ